jgi:sugar lactone lactonase YvrE
MTRTARVAAAAATAFVAVLAAGLATANPPRATPAENLVKGKGDLTWTTVFRSPRAIEGLTADTDGNLYTADRGTPCSVLRIPASGGAAVVVGKLVTSAACGPSGLTFGRDGRLYVTNSDGRIYVLTPDAAAPPTATVFAEGVPGANGVAFDRAGNLWTGDGTTGLGRVWRISPAGVVTEMFRVPPTANGKGVGRQTATLQGTGTTPNPQTLVANGVAFAHDGSLLVADTARGAIWQVDLDSDGSVLSPTGCDTTFTDDTLCLDALLVEHPALEGADGIALDRAGTIWTAANERNAIVAVSQNGDRVDEVFRNPPTAAGLRNAGPLETPTSPLLIGKRLCVTQSDGGRRDNAPNSAGEAAPGTSVVAKISCLDQELDAPGLPLPVG